jgi:hypothetical protein
VQRGNGSSAGTRALAPAWVDASWSHPGVGRKPAYLDVRRSAPTSVGARLRLMNARKPAPR